MKSLNILVAEDNDDHAELIIDALAESSHETQVHRVSNGRELLNYLDECLTPDVGPKRLPDIILLDIKMPLVSGIGALETLKSHAVYKTIPVLMLSTSAHDDDVEKCYQLGANSYIVKPFDHEQFEKKIQEVYRYWGDTSLLP